MPTENYREGAFPTVWFMAALVSIFLSLAILLGHVGESLQAIALNKHVAWLAVQNLDDLSMPSFLVFCVVAAVISVYIGYGLCKTPSELFLRWWRTLPLQLAISGFLVFGHQHYALAGPAGLIRGSYIFGEQTTLPWSNVRSVELNCHLDDTPKLHTSYFVSFWAPPEDEETGDSTITISLLIYDTQEESAANRHRAGVLQVHAQLRAMSVPFHWKEGSSAQQCREWLHQNDRISRLPTWVFERLWQTE